MRTEFYVGAQLLQGTHGCSSGNKRLFELTDSFRSSLVNNARCMGLFQDRPKTVPINDSLEARWHAWISDERLCRLAWAVYVSPFSFVLHRCRVENLRNTIRQSANPTTLAHFSVFLKSIYPCRVHYHVGRQKPDMFGSLYIRGQSPCQPIPLSDPCFTLFSKVRTQFLQRPQIFNMISSSSSIL